jgi:alpha-glucosidase
LPEHTTLPDDVRQDPIWFRSGGTQRGRDGCRVPLPWEAGRPGFGFGPTGRTWLPQPASWATLTAQAQAGDLDSTLELDRRALRLRREHPALGDGQMRWIDSPDRTLAFARDPGFVCLVNLSARPVPVPVGANTLLASSPLADHGRSLPPDTTVWLAR